MNDQTAKADKGKIRPTLVPRELIRVVAIIRGYGNAKYPEGGEDNWKRVEPQRYRDALCRHLMAYLDNPRSVDEESGYPHLWHLATNVAFLCELEKDKFNDSHKEIPKQSCAGDIIASYTPPIMHRVERNSNKSLWQAIKELLA